MQNFVQLFFAKPTISYFRIAERKCERTLENDKVSFVVLSVIINALKCIQTTFGISRAKNAF